MEKDEHMRYLGALKLLEECSPYVAEDLRESIQCAMDDAVAASGGRLQTTRIADRIRIDVVANPPKPEDKCNSKAVTEELRQSIRGAMDDAIAASEGRLRTTRIADSIRIDAVASPSKSEDNSKVVMLPWKARGGF